jgi:hypothetical protein
MRSLFATLILAVAIGVVGAAPAAASIEPYSTALKATYTCDATYSNYTSCTELVNDVQNWGGPGTLKRDRPLTFVAANLKTCYSARQQYWNAQRSIGPTATGAAQTNGSTCAGGVFNYGIRVADGPPNYQATVAVVANPYYAPTKGCIVSNYLACEQGPEQETGRDSRIKYTISSRPFEVKIINSLPVELKRANGPYWSNMLWVPKSDNAGAVAATNGVAYTGALRSVVKTSAYSAIYRVTPSTANTLYNGALIAIDVKTSADGANTGTCTPLFAPSKTPINCSVDFTGTTVLTATVRVRP